MKREIEMFCKTVDNGIINYSYWCLIFEYGVDDAVTGKNIKNDNSGQAGRDIPCFFHVEYCTAP